MGRPGLNKEEFVARARNTHGNKYDYSKVEYKNNRIKVCIVCPEHGDFWQCTQDHIKGRGCPICGRKKLRESMLAKSNRIICKCDECGKEFYLSKCYLKRERKHRFCSRACEAEFRKYHNTAESWIGGRINISTGYKTIRINGKERDEHRLVMERHLGRPLRSDEVVHHINGDKQDN